MFGWNGYLWPRPVPWFAVALASWWLLTPDRTVARTFSQGWVLPILARNVVLVLVCKGVVYLFLYRLKVQDAQYKYNRRFPGGPNPNFLMGSQLIDNLFYTLVWTIPIMTLCEAWVLWMLANGDVARVDWQDQPVWLTALILSIPLLHLVHFHLVHRLVHWGPLYRWVHAVHHRNVNPTPWSSLSMHPVEGLPTFLSFVYYFLVPSNELGIIAAVIYNFSPASEAHLGFGKVIVGADGKTVNETANYYHYLHHRYHECNYTGSVIDRWFGTLHDGTVTTHKRLKARLARMNV